MKRLAHQAYHLLGIQLNAAQLNALTLYERELIAWNQRMNLTAIHEPEQIQVKHFLDSLTCMCALNETSMDRIIDVGTGAGFPGLPLKILNPSIELTLIESVGKKADFCRHIIRVLGLEGVKVIQERAEVIGQKPSYRQQYDWAIARAVAIMPVLVEYLLPLVRVGGSILAMKGESAPAEAHDADHAIHLLGGHLRKLIPVTLPGVAEERYLIVVDKVAATPDAYPRRVGLPTKKPIL
jgi:16S rRNA (guanine527-N7)-methyltransferase